MRLLPADSARTGDWCGAGTTCGTQGEVALMFFFSNRLGCLGSIAVSLVGTLILLLVLGVINLD